MMSIRETIRSLRWADFIMANLADPRLFARKLEESGFAVHPGSFFVIVFYVLVMQLSFAALADQSSFFVYKMSYGLALHVLMAFGLILAAALASDLFFQMSCRPGAARQAFSIAAYALTPQLLVLPGTMMAVSLDIAPPLFWVLFLMGAAVWSVYILISATSEFRGVSFARAAASYAVPAIILAGSSLVVMISFGGLLFGFFASL
jgi:hypothetical protein